MVMESMNELGKETILRHAFRRLESKFEVGHFQLDLLVVYTMVDFDSVFRRRKGPVIPKIIQRLRAK